MRLLLDTHVWIWSVSAPQKLKPTVSRALEDADNELWLSPVSIWEFLLWMERGRIELRASPDVVIAKAMGPLKEAPLTHEVALQMRSVTLSHRDPGDRLLAATARYYDLTLVTADERMLAGKGFRKLANR